MQPQPRTNGQPRNGQRLFEKVVLITGGDSGIGRATAVAAAREGARIAIVYLNEHEDAAETQRLVEELDRPCLAVAGDVGDEALCRRTVEQTLDEFGRLDVLVNNAGEQHPQEKIEDIAEDQIERTFRTNVFAQFFMVKAALPHMKSGSSIVNIASITA
ncbi:MAG: SDR family NAD(P)-dependent oxidoreductase, partial [Candidatus Eremiobacteraeota bacterium]|nr:SDR family NAD(P)-dependent oxidoreductase [Candidatus Eremiobacteraeota bacterium]